MALASKKTGTIHGKSGGNKTKLQAKFDEGALDHLADHPDDFPQNAAFIYAMQNITEDIDALRTYAGTELRGTIATNTAKTGISSSQATAIVANTAKVGTETNLSITEGITLKATVTNDRGSYAIIFTMVTADGRTTKTGKVALS